MVHILPFQKLKYPGGQNCHNLLAQVTKSSNVLCPFALRLRGFHGVNPNYIYHYDQLLISVFINCPQTPVSRNRQRPVW